VIPPSPPGVPEPGGPGTGDGVAVSVNVEFHPAVA
jgi:hypothetical protein